MKHRTLAMICATVALAAPQVALAKPALDSKLWTGTWQLNSAKSKFSSAEYTPKKDTRTYAVTGVKVTMRSNSVGGDGKPMTWSYSAPANGKPYPTAGNPNVDRVALTIVGPRELKSETSLKGKTSATATLSVSGDGKELTVKRSLVTPKGATDDTMIFDRTK